MSDVPDELLLEILSRLPVAPLLRFRCISKSWKLLNETNMATFKQLSHPLKTSSGETEILGSCDGLLVLRTEKKDITTLWNPSVKRFHMIPSTTSIILSGIYMRFFYGFGYDVVSDDYKLITIPYFSGKDGKFNSEVLVYCLKSDSWRRIPDFPYDLTYASFDGVLANGALHWIVTGNVKSDRSIAAFHLGTEEYRLVPLPKIACHDNIYCLQVAVLGGCLSVMCYVNDVHYDLWVMKEYGVQESWSVLISYDIRNAMMRPLAYSKCGRKVLLSGSNDKVLRWYDLDKKSFNVPMLEMPSEYIYESYTCLQSLVLLNNGAHDFDLVVKKKRKRKGKKGSSRKRKCILA